MGLLQGHSGQSPKLSCSDNVQSFVLYPMWPEAAASESLSSMGTFARSRVEIASPLPRGRQLPGRATPRKPLPLWELQLGSEISEAPCIGDCLNFVHTCVAAKDPAVGTSAGSCRKVLPGGLWEWRPAIAGQTSSTSSQLPASLSTTSEKNCEERELRIQVASKGPSPALGLCRELGKA